jgi:3-phosphoshikimate 1-carboxyvinyltransferase
MIQTTPLPTKASPSSMTLSGARSANGYLQLPGSKSLSIRALLLAALSAGTTQLTGVLDSDDTRVMLTALQQLGVEITVDNHTNVYSVTGCGEGACAFKNSNADIFVGNSGLSIRTLAAALSATQGQFRLHGVARMHERPIADLVDSLAQVGAAIEYESATGYPPLLITGGAATANTPLPTIRVKGNASSQYLTGLLQIAPLLSVKHQQTITVAVDGELISKPYIDMTVQLMAQFGVIVERDSTGYGSFSIAANTRYHSPKTFAVEGDASSASYFLAAGALGFDSLTVRGAGRTSLQGDVHFATFLASIGIAVTWGDDSITVQGRRGIALPAFDQDFNHIPDAAMTAAVVALFADGRCVLRNIGSWRVKETDRLAAMANELRKVGALVEEGSDYLAITPPHNGVFKTASIHTYDDHRMAMCFALLRFAGIDITIEDPGCVNKTFPDFFTVLDRITTP